MGKKEKKALPFKIRLALHVARQKSSVDVTAAHPNVVKRKKKKKKWSALPAIPMNSSNGTRTLPVHLKMSNHPNSKSHPTLSQAAINHVMAGDGAEGSSQSSFVTHKLHTVTHTCTHKQKKKKGTRLGKRKSQMQKKKERRMKMLWTARQDHRA